MSSTFAGHRAAPHALIWAEGTTHPPSRSLVQCLHPPHPPALLCPHLILPPTPHPAPPSLHHRRIRLHLIAATRLLMMLGNVITAATTDTTRVGLTTVGLGVGAGGRGEGRGGASGRAGGRGGRGGVGRLPRYLAACKAGLQEGGRIRVRRGAASVFHSTAALF